MIAGSWVDETFANGHHAAEDRAAADALQSAPATWQPSSVHVPPMVRRNIAFVNVMQRALLQLKPGCQSVGIHFNDWMVILPSACLSGERGGGCAVVGAGGDARRPQLGRLLHARGRVHGCAQPRQRQQRLPAAGQVGFRAAGFPSTRRLQLALSSLAKLLSNISTRATFLWQDT